MRNFIISTLILSILAVISCREDEEVIDTPPVVVDSTLTVDISGYVQKGPFINGTAITVSELDKKLVTTGKNFTTQIADNKGSFSLKGIKLKSNFVQLQADGFYFDEVKGEKSAAQLTLFALSDLKDITNINANLLSHMERTRVIYLMQEEEKSFVDAKQQAQQEILTVFGIEKEDIQHSEVLDISQEGDDNAILLAISAILQADNSVAELSELVANIITDLREDGVLNSETSKTKLREQAMSLNLPQIRAHLEKRYADMGVEASIPNFEQYIDSDGDGILNKDEDDTPENFEFTTQKDVAINTKVISNAVKISGLKEGGTADAVVQNGHILLNDKLLEDSVVQIRNGDQLQLQLTSSSGYMDTVSTKITIGTLVKSFTAISDDYTPDAFSFTAQKDVAIDSFYTSNTITVSGIPFATPLKIEGGTMIKNGEELESDTTSVKNGDELAVKLLSSSEFEANTSALVDINGISASFSIITDDYTPDPFSFTSIENAERDSVYTSNTITISGLPHATPIFLDSGSLFINGKVVSNESATVKDGDKVMIQLTSKNDFDHVSKALLQINTFNRTFEVSTPDNVWQQITVHPGGIGNIEISGFVIDNKIYIGPGDINRRYFYEYNPGTKQWTQKADLPKIIDDQGDENELRGRGTGFSVNGKGYLFGLYNGCESHAFFEYDPDTDIWTKKADYPAMGVCDMVSFSIGDYGYMEGWRYDPSHDLWTEIAKTPFLEEKRAELRAGFSTKEKGYTILNNNFWEYDPGTDTWKQLSDYPGEPSSRHFVDFVIGEYAYVGSSVSAYDLDPERETIYAGSHEKTSFWRYEFKTDTWKKIDIGSFYFQYTFNCSASEKGYHWRNDNWSPNIYEFTPPQE
ncbi:Kelch repeat-containing protein [Catalinimonas alkaloidigena]|uniref:Kelch repeat-containing protein n=1 Tax=Catalinimonas alkaloidigena TaxID=1075417 RepID=UPI00240537CD|nr:hypothetical protein [Catalinimonas alkaloidigena]